MRSLNGAYVTTQGYAGAKDVLLGVCVWRSNQGLTREAWDGGLSAEFDIAHTLPYTLLRELQPRGKPLGSQGHGEAVEAG